MFQNRLDGLCTLCKTAEPRFQYDRSLAYLKHVRVRLNRLGHVMAYKPDVYATHLKRPVAR